MRGMGSPALSTLAAGLAGLVAGFYLGQRRAPPEGSTAPGPSSDLLAQRQWLAVSRVVVSFDPPSLTHLPCDPPPALGWRKTRP